MLNLWCDGCRTIVHAAAAYHRPTDDRFPWLPYILPGEPHMWLCPRCQGKHPDLIPFLVRPAPRGAFCCARSIQ